jgi:predicted dehydrogenase
MQQIGGFRVVALYDPIEALHKKGIAALNGGEGVHITSDYAAFLSTPGMNAVALAVRCKEQGAMAAQALEAGKHVHSEVPAAHTIEDCWRIVVAQERSGCVYHLGEQMRHAGYIEAWRKLVEAGTLGSITYAEGQYFHYYLERTFQNPATGQFVVPSMISNHDARAESSPTWFYYMPPIHYLPHDLGPLLKVLDDRVVEVIGMSTDSPSRAHPEVIAPDMQVALMKTAKGTMLRLLASFSQPHPHLDTHWQQVVGTKGAVEWRRSGDDKPKMWLADSQLHDKCAMEWRLERTDAPPSASGSGHSDLDYYVHVAFRDAVLDRIPPELDVYKAMDITAPGILAGDSIEAESRKLIVPDFRPGSERAFGCFPGTAV